MLYVLRKHTLAKLCGRHLIFLTFFPFGFRDDWDANELLDLPWVAEASRGLINQCRKEILPKFSPFLRSWKSTWEAKYIRHCSVVCLWCHKSQRHAKNKIRKCMLVHFISRLYWCMYVSKVMLEIYLNELSLETARWHACDNMVFSLVEEA